jgi:gluconate kinase
VVVILAGAGGSGPAFGRALANELGWRFEDARPPRNETDRDHWATQLHGLVARVLDRREPLVVACPTLDARLRNVLLDGLRQVRFVQFAKNPARERPFETITIDDSLSTDSMIAEIRREIGI